MVNALQQGPVHRGPKRLRQTPGPGRGADLVTDYREAVPFCQQPQHGLDKIAAKTRVDPAGAHDQRPWMCRQHRALALQLAATIGTQGCRPCLWRVGVPGFAVEDEIRGDMYQPGTGAGAGSGKVARTLGIDLQGQRFLPLSPIYRRVGSCIEDPVRAQFAKNAAHLLWLADIQRAAVEADQRNARRGGQLQLATQLATGAG